MSAVPSLATTDEILNSVRMTGAVTVQDRLTELATKFKEAAKFIDPTITGAWFGYDPNEGNLFWVQFERKGGKTNGLF